MEDQRLVVEAIQKKINKAMKPKIISGNVTAKPILRTVLKRLVIGTSCEPTGLPVALIVRTTADSDKHQRRNPRGVPSSASNPCL